MNPAQSWCLGELLATHTSEVDSKRFWERELPVYFPSPLLSTDNAAMIAAAGYPEAAAWEVSDLALNAGLPV